MLAIFPAIEEDSEKEVYQFAVRLGLVVGLAPIDAANVAPYILLRLQFPKRKYDSVQSKQNRPKPVVGKIFLCEYVCVLCMNLSYFSRFFAFERLVRRRLDFKALILLRRWR